MSPELNLAHRLWDWNRFVFSTFLTFLSYLNLYRPSADFFLNLFAARSPASLNLGLFYVSPFPFFSTEMILVCFFSFFQGKTLRSAAIWLSHFRSGGVICFCVMTPDGTPKFLFQTTVYRSLNF